MATGQDLVLPERGAKMTHTEQIARPNLSAGDAAVDGLVYGALAGIPMAIYAAVAWLLFDPGAGEIFGDFMADRDLSIINTLLLHLAVSSIYGLIFSLGFNGLARLMKTGLSPWVSLNLGMVYGAILLALANLVVLPASAAPLELPLALSLPAHLIYGAALGLLVHRNRFSPAR
jgi:hypothetical protein